MNIVVVSNNYPSHQLPSRGVFVYNLMQKLSKYHDITVISPMKITDFFKKKTCYGDEACHVVRPIYLSIGNRKFLGMDFEKLSFFFRKKATQRSFNQLKEEIDLIYCHFLNNGLAIDEVADKKKIPMVIASGESAYQSLGFVKSTRLSLLLKRTSRIICVSLVNSVYIHGLGYPKSKITLVPNAVDYGVFKPMDKHHCKKKHGINESDFVVGFIGHFIERKGPNRVIEAISKIGDPKITFVAVGKGDSLLPGDFVKELAPMANSKLPGIINAFDVFVLPTLSEGHCNVIEEVKACGVPVISSRGTTVEQQIDQNSGILIDPLDIHAITGAIRHLRDNPGIRESMVRHLLSVRGENTIENRAYKINTVLSEATLSY
ncbi:glycosyltransferase [Algoriphagus sp. NG3]|uniref:glycosyltransferase n=1 Tax=unclassified Algoriphagus TaxID=2641541 RepID=UPI002A80D710|nr:glycosyltransferase [Algoriphagus sp. NG3]WPR77823.1 glycosyltransferase [Algoriphagus sp. NG3]